MPLEIIMFLRISTLRLARVRYMLVTRYVVFEAVVCGLRHLVGIPKSVFVGQVVKVCDSPFLDHLNL